VPSTLEKVIDQCHATLGDIIRGNTEPWTKVFSRRDDVTLGNPFGPFVRGFDDVMAAARNAGSRYRDGEIVSFEACGKLRRRAKPAGEPPCNVLWSMPRSGSTAFERMKVARGDQNCGASQAIESTD
jgi:hypothetical protein